MLLATNERTATKATIKRASARARREMNRLDRDALRELQALYSEAQRDIAASIRGYAGSDGSLRLEVLQDLLNQVEARLDRLAQMRDLLLDDEILYASALGAGPYQAALGHDAVTAVAHQAAEFVRSFTAEDGLQLSDRLWRLNAGAKEGVTGAIQSAVIQGHSASRAAQEFLQRGAPVPKEIQQRMGQAGAERVARLSSDALMKDEGNPYYQARRLFRTELNRAHGEAYMAGGEEVEDFAGWRFLLSSGHPAPDICDMHARANLYGLGPGVYPTRELCPWPAHPNTLSYVEIVFRDEITNEDRAGRTSRLDWLKGQPQNMQAAVLGSKRKAAALRADVLKRNQITTPWRVLEKYYRRKGIDPAAFKAERTALETLQGTQLFGIRREEFEAYSRAAFAAAPTSVAAVLDRVPPPASIRVIPSGTSYFQGNGIVLARTSMVKTKYRHSKHDVYRHEYGHYVDFWALSDGRRVVRVVSSTPDKNGGMLDTIHAARRSLYLRSDAQRARRVRLNSELVERMDLHLADLFGALTKNKIGWGHSTGYLSRPGFAETEVFANLFDIYSREDRTSWQFLSQELPDLANRFVEVLEAIAR